MIRPEVIGLTQAMALPERAHKEKKVTLSPFGTISTSKDVEEAYQGANQMTAQLTKLEVQNVYSLCVPNLVVPIPMLSIGNMCYLDSHRLLLENQQRFKHS